MAPPGPDLSVIFFSLLFMCRVTARLSRKKGIYREKSFCLLTAFNAISILGLWRKWLKDWFMQKSALSLDLWEK
jgi:hypothetical protein